MSHYKFETLQLHVGQEQADPATDSRAVPIYVDKEKIWQAFGGILPGMFLLASAYATRQAIGYGDGLAVCVCGLYLGMGQTFAMLFYALLFCSVVSAVMLVCKKRTYKTGVPFVPYLIAGYLCTFL